LWNQVHTEEIILEHIHVLAPMSNVCGVNDERLRDFFYKIIFLEPVTTYPLSQLHMMLPLCRLRCWPVSDLWAAFHSYMEQTFDKTHHEMMSGQWDSPCAVVVHVDHSNALRNSSGTVNCTYKSFSRYRQNDFRAKIEPPSCLQYKPGTLQGVGLLNRDEKIDEDERDGNWVDSVVPSSGMSRPLKANNNDEGKGEDDMQGGEKVTGKVIGSKDEMGIGKQKVKGKGKATEEGKGKGDGNSKGKGIVKHTPVGDDISHAVALQLLKEMYDPDSDMEG